MQQVAVGAADAAGIDLDQNLARGGDGDWHGGGADIADGEQSCGLHHERIPLAGHSGGAGCLRQRLYPGHKRKMSIPMYGKLENLPLSVHPSMV